MNALFSNNSKRFLYQSKGTFQITVSPVDSMMYLSLIIFSKLSLILLLRGEIILSEMIIKYKRIKWTPSCKASLLLPGGYYIFKRLEEPKSGSPSNTKIKKKEFL